LTTFADRPDDQRLTTTNVTRLRKPCRHWWLVAAFAIGRGLGVLARILADAESIEQAADRVGEAHGQEGVVARQFEFRTGDFGSSCRPSIQDGRPSAP
jgi:hypothetical protein